MQCSSQASHFIQSFWGVIGVIPLVVSQMNVFCLVHTKDSIMSILGTICAPNDVSLEPIALHVLFQKLKHSRHGQWEQGVIVSDGERGTLY